MAHIQHLGACLLHCGAQPRLLPRAAVRRACPVHCLNAPASWSAERELRFGGESAAVAAHSKPSFTSTERVDLSRTVLFMSSAAKNLTARPFAEFILSIAEGLRVTDLLCQSFVVRFSMPKLTGPMTALTGSPFRHPGSPLKARTRGGWATRGLLPSARQSGQEPWPISCSS